MDLVDKSDVEILIVDDSPANLDILMTMLQQLGYRTIHAEDGPKALQVAQERLPALILLDVMMPGMSGFEVCERLKELPETKTIPILFMSALDNVQDKVRAFQVGGVDYISKPFHLREVVARVEAQVTLHAQWRHIEQLLGKERAYYESLNSMKDEMIHTTTHDLKNPLSIIAGYASLLQDTPSVMEDPMTAEFVNEILRAIERMQRLITDLLDLAQIETGLAVLPQDMDMATLLKQVHNDFRFPAQQKNITLNVVIHAEEIPLRADINRLYQALTNLLSNAIKYTPEGGAVTVATADEGDDIRIEVADTGLGIPEDAIPRLFDKFYRVTEEAHQAITGTGLGLAIVKAIIDEHDGEIYVQSKLGEGTTFTLFIPKLVEGISL